jgi:hypothetical protein
MIDQHETLSPDNLASALADARKKAMDALYHYADVVTDTVTRCSKATCNATADLLDEQGHDTDVGTLTAILWGDYSQPGWTAMDEVAQDALLYDPAGRWNGTNMTSTDPAAQS